MTRPTSNAAPVVSFGLPVRNGAPTIAQAIESVLAQTFEDWELVISDNLSTDGTSEICASFAARDERIRHVPTGPRPLDSRELPRGVPSLARHVLPVARRRRLARAPVCRARRRRSRRSPGCRPLHDGSAVPPRRTPAAGARPHPRPRRCGLAGRRRPSSRAAPPAPERRPPRNRPGLLAGAAGRRGTDGPSRLHPRRGLRVLVRDGAPRAVRPRARRSWRIADCCAVSRLGISRNFLQREQSIFCVARASKSLTTRSRARVCAALARVRGERARARRSTPRPRGATDHALDCALDTSRDELGASALRPRASARRRRTSSVTSGRAKNGTGRMSFPFPARRASCLPSSRTAPTRARLAGCASVTRRPGSGRQI